jgi:MutS domain V
MKVYLLFRDRDFDFGADLPVGHQDLIEDLELTTLLQAMAAGDKFLLQVSTKVLLACLQDPEAIRYRQQVLADCLVAPEVIREMYAVAVGALDDRRHLWGYGGSYQSASSNLSGAVAYLEAYVARLRQLRRIAGEHAGTFRSEGLRTLCATLQRELDDEYFEEISDHLKHLRFRAGVLISAELDRDNSGTGFTLRAPADTRRRWTQRLGIGPRTTYSFTIPPRDEAGGQILEDLTSRGINLVANAAAQSADHIGSYFTMLRIELGFYVSCLNLAGRLAAKGAPVTVPDLAPPSPSVFSCTDLRDACLELQSPSPVVGNDVQADGKSLVIITGANSGGKSTFMRSVGVAQLMMQCGLFVTAEAFRAGVASGIFTHFIREEDAGMTSGRLDDELRRMSIIAAHIRPHCLMLFNESFAGTNEREGSEIGYQVVRALLDADITVFFVTHRFDFAERFQQQRARSTLFLRAERQPDGRRNYKLAVKEPLPTSFGEDLYYRLGAWLDEDKAIAARRGLASRLPEHRSARADVPQLGRQQARDPATWPRSAPPLGLVLGLLHDRVVIVRPGPARALVVQRAGAARRLARRLARRAPAGPERHQRPPQQQDLVLVHLGQRSITCAWSYRDRWRHLRGIRRVPPPLGYRIAGPGLRLDAVPNSGTIEADG